MSTPQRPSIDATERSISPVTTISVSGGAMIATSPTFRQMKKRLVECRKYGETEAPYAIVPPRTKSSRTSQRTTAPRLCRPGGRAPASSPGLRSSISATRPPPRPEGRRHAQRDQPVEGDCREQQAARDGLAPEGRDVDDDERAVDRVQEQRAERGAEDGAAAAEDRHAADDDGGDHLELVSDAGDRVDRAVVGQPDGAGQPGYAAAEHEGEEDARANRNAREPRRSRVRADGVKVARRAERAHRVGRRTDRDDRDHGEE